MILAASMALPPPKLTMPWAAEDCSTPASISDIGACWEMTVVAIGLTFKGPAWPSRDRVVTSATRSILSRSSSGASCAIAPRPQWMTRGFAYVKEEGVKAVVILGRGGDHPRSACPPGRRSDHVSARGDDPAARPRCYGGRHHDDRLGGASPRLGLPR